MNALNISQGEIHETSIFFDRDQPQFAAFLGRVGLAEDASDEEITAYMVEANVSSVLHPDYDRAAPSPRRPA